MALAPLFPAIHSLLSPLFPGCLWQGAGDQPTLALTFDDGPHPEYTLPLLAVLERNQVTANFFWLGAWVDHTPEVAKAVYDQGHWIGLHGYTHHSFPCLSVQDLRESLEQTQGAITHACGLTHPIMDVRPPNGLFTPQILTRLRQWHYRPVMWTIVPEDWVCPGVDLVVQRMFNQMRNGAILVLHDGPQGGKDVAAVTAQLLPGLLAQGYQFVTIDRLWSEHLSSSNPRN